MYKGTSKPFAESIYSIEAVKTEYFLHHQMNLHQIEALLKCCNRLDLKYSNQYFEVCWRVLVLHLKNTSVLTASIEYILSTRCSDVPLYMSTLTLMYLSMCSLFLVSY